jgi:hypothetical protein
MEQRPLRLGDIVDDYCPRERRITNHAIVVMTGDTIELTRCTACESEHPFKHAKLPAKKTKDGEHEVRATLRVRTTGTVRTDQSVPTDHGVPEPVAPAYEPQAPSDAPAPESFHRPLIRAALPKGIVPPAPRPLPDFTMRSIRNRDGRDGRSNGRRFSR